MWRRPDRGPLDPTGGIKGTITIGFEYYPRFDQSTPARGTLLPQEGGPGYSSTGTRDAYLNIFGALREHRYAPLDAWVVEGIAVWVKHENHNPTGSFKARNGLSAIRAIPTR